MRKSRLSTLFVFAILLSMATIANAQPFDAFLSNGGVSGTYIEVPHAAALNLTSGFTIEAWVQTRIAAGHCGTIVGKNYNQAYWIGICQEGGALPTLRSYSFGGSSAYTSGLVPVGRWAHIAVTTDGTTRKHYVNGELVGTRTDTTPISASTSPLRLSSDISWNFATPALDEVRIWNVARTVEQIRSTINVKITGTPANLVAYYHLDGTGADALGAHNGTQAGAGGGFLTLAAGGTCTSNDTTLCAQTGRYRLKSYWQVPDGGTGVGHVVSAPAGNSGLFWFFSSDNWELLAKVLNGCAINNRKWVFSAATTNVHYELVVEDLTRGEQRVYFNYQGINAPAVNDTDGFATCP